MGKNLSKARLYFHHMMLSGFKFNDFSGLLKQFNLFSSCNLYFVHIYVNRAHSKSVIRYRKFSRSSENRVKTYLTATH